MIEVIEWFLANPWASFLGIIVTGLLLRQALIRGYGADL